MSVNASEVKNLSMANDSKFISGMEGNSKRNNGIQEVGTNTQPISVSETQEIVKSLEKYMNVLQTSLGFRVNNDTDRVVVTITNRETNEVIRQLPPEELVALQERMKELTGIIFSETA
ncbi:MAG: flagellar protein FlaG [Pseudomonadota bacterium]